MIIIYTDIVEVVMKYTRKYVIPVICAVCAVFFAVPVFAQNSTAPARPAGPPSAGRPADPPSPARPAVPPARPGMPGHRQYKADEEILGVVQSVDTAKKQFTLIDDDEDYVTIQVYDDTAITIEDVLSARRRPFWGTVTPATIPDIAVGDGVQLTTYDDDRRVVDAVVIEILRKTN